VVCIGQLPLPLQVAAGVATPAAHEASRQGVPEGWLRQAPAPLQVPSVPQLVAGVTMHMPLGSATPEGTLVQVPTEPPTVQLRQPPAQASLQQTPSAQMPETHSGPALQEVPLPFLPQMLLWHWLGGTHWLLASQDEKQAPLLALHLNGAQAWVAPARQVPLPSQNDAATALSPLQDGAAHWVVAGCMRQPPDPLQVPSRPQLFVGWAAQRASGSTPPGGTLVQVPTDPGTLQLWQVAPQALLQHTPWAQKLLAHSSPRAQICPSPFFPQDVPWQVFGAWQSLLVPQVFPQAVPLHLYGAQLVGAGLAQLPLLHVPCWVRWLVVALQLAARQTVPLA
jgi:hypothetical protein